MPRVGNGALFGCVRLLLVASINEWALNTCSRAVHAVRDPRVVKWRCYWGVVIEVHYATKSCVAPTLAAIIGPGLREPHCKQAISWAVRIVLKSSVKVPAVQHACGCGLATGFRTAAARGRCRVEVVMLLSSTHA